MFSHLKTVDHITVTAMCVPKNNQTLDTFVPQSTSKHGSRAIELPSVMRHSSHRLLSWRSLVYQLSVQNATLRHLQHDRRKVAFSTRGPPSASRLTIAVTRVGTRGGQSSRPTLMDVHLEVAEHHEIFFTKYYGLDAVAVQLGKRTHDQI